MRLIDADECLAFLKENCSKDMYLAVRAILDPCKTVNAVVIPKNATFGDMIKVMFPDAKIVKAIDFVGYKVLFGENLFWCYFDMDLWNSLYKRGNENE